MADWVAEAARNRPDAPALIHREGVLTFGDLHDAAEAVAGTVTGGGFGPGERVAFWGENTVRAAAAVWGLPRAGVWTVPVSTRLPAAEAMALTRETGVRGLWAPSRLDLPRRPGTSVAWGPPESSARYVVFTSGSGGTRKGVVLTGANVEAAVTASRRRIGNGPEDRWLCVLPLAHVGGLSILWRSAAVGGAVVLEHGFDAERCAGLMATGGVTLASLVPTQLRRILAVHRGPYEGLRSVLVGGGPISTELIERARAAGIPALPTYGMTEACSQIATDDGGDPSTVGRPLDGMEVQVVEGQIEIRGPAVFAGYVGEEPRGAEGWHRTGDLGAVDADGRLRIFGRADEVIVTGGENVHPARVESVLLGHPAIEDVVVRGRPDPEWGSVVVAEVVVAGSRAFDREQVEAFARRRLAGFEVPKMWQTVEKIERDEVGKRTAG